MGLYAKNWLVNQIFVMKNQTRFGDELRQEGGASCQCNAAIAPGSISASSGIVKSEGSRKKKQC